MMLRRHPPWSPMSAMLPDQVHAEPMAIGRRVVTGLALAGLLGMARQATAQQMGKVSRIGVLLPWSGPTPEDTQYIEGDRPRYRALGWVEGQNLFVERRWVGTGPDRMREVAAELKALRVELIVTMGTTAIRAARDGAPGVPIVMVAAGDPVGAGFVQSLAHPGGDLTGTSSAGAESLGKALELLTAAAPRVRTVRVVMAAANPANGFFHGALTAAAKQLGVQLERVDGAAWFQWRWHAQQHARERSALTVRSPRSREQARSGRLRRHHRVLLAPPWRQASR